MSVDEDTIEIKGDRIDTITTTVSTSTNENVEVHTLKHALEEFYQQFNPEKVSTIDEILVRYHNNEIELLKNLMDKYNVTEYKLFDKYLGNDLIVEKEMQTVSKSVSLNVPVQLLRPVLSSNGVQSKQPATPTKDVIVNSVQPSLATLSSGMQDISTRLFTGWTSAGNNVSTSSVIQHVSSQSQLNKSNLMSSPSVPFIDDSVWIARLSSLQTDLQTAVNEKNGVEAEARKSNNQLLAYKKENSALRAENVDLKSKYDSLVSQQRNHDGASDQSKEHDKLRIELTERLLAAEARTANKHTQLLETALLNQRLEAQMRYLAVHAFSTSMPLEGQGDADGLVVVDAVDDNRFDQLIEKAIPEVRTILCQKRTDASLSAEPGHTTLNEDDAETELIQLRETVRVLQTSYATSRIEFRLEVRRRAALEERLSEQQTEIDRLRKKLSSTDTELETASGSADTMKQQISEAMSEVAHYKMLIAQTDDVSVNRDKEVQHLRREAARLEECLVVSEQARSDLSSICAERIRESCNRANEYVRCVKETVHLEREDMLARLVNTAALSEELRVAVSTETQRELQRLRDELFKARRNETQKEREIAFLQRQLVEAARRIAQESVEREHHTRQHHDRHFQNQHDMGDYEV